jgi:hypothetical protein
MPPRHTGHKRESNLLDRLSLGSDGHVLKPVTREMLARLVRRLRCENAEELGSA